MRPILAQVALCGVLCYFAYHALAGDQGLARWTELQRQEKDLLLKRDALVVEKAAIEDRIRRLQPDNIDLDYVEELARKKLAYARPDEVIVRAPATD